METSPNPIANPTPDAARPRVPRPPQRLLEARRGDALELRNMPALPLVQRGGLAVLRVDGAISLVPYWWDEIPTAELVAAIDRAAADSSIRELCLDMHCPGGSSQGSADLLAAVRAFKATGKRLSAIAHDQMCSLGYWFACLADELVCTPSAIVGHIGAIAYGVDSSGAYTQAGLRAVARVSGKHKATLYPGVPVSAENEAVIDATVAANALQFFEAVAEGREMTVDQVRSLEAAWFYGPDALAQGLVDRVVDSRDYFAELALRHGGAASGVAVVVAKTPRASAPAPTAGTAISDASAEAPSMKPVEPDPSPEPDMTTTPPTPATPAASTTAAPIAATPAPASAPTPAAPAAASQAPVAATVAELEALFLGRPEQVLSCLKRGFTVAQAQAVQEAIAAATPAPAPAPAAATAPASAPAAAVAQAAGGTATPVGTPPGARMHPSVTPEAQASPFEMLVREIAKRPEVAKLGTMARGQAVQLAARERPDLWTAQKKLDESRPRRKSADADDAGRGITRIDPTQVPAA